MTFKINNTEASYEILENGKLVVSLGTKKLGTFEPEQLTSLITITLAARKAGYEFKRAAKVASREARKSERAAKTAATKEAQIAKLQAQLAKLSGTENTEEVAA